LGRVKAPWAFRKGRKNERHGGYRGRWYYQVIQGNIYVTHKGEYFLLMKEGRPTGGGGTVIKVWHSRVKTAVRRNTGTIT